MSRANRIKNLFPLITLLATLGTLHTATAQGPVVTGVGPVNRTMGGAGTAAPLDSIGALHWNPASISALPTSEVSFGVELLLPSVELTSDIPAIGGAGSTNSESGVAPIPAVGWVHHLDDSRFTIGLGLYGVGGFRLNHQRDPDHPLLNAAGPIFSDAEFLQIAPTVAFAVTERLSIGLAPTVTMGKATLIPLGPPITATTTPSQGNRVHWGAGFQAGVYYVTPSCWHLGFTFKSPQWFEDYRFFTPDGVVKFGLDYPMILSLGTAYSGFERWVFAFDARYFDFKNTSGYDELGWRSVYAIALGAQYRLTDSLYLRGGYNYNENPIPADETFLNLATPLIQQHNISLGASWRLACNVDINVGYVYLANNDIQGPAPAALGGGTVRNEIDAHSLVTGVTVRY